jgi:hypothetical protein
LKVERESSGKAEKELEKEKKVTRRMKEVIQQLAVECPWQTEKSAAPGGKLLDELLELAK